MNNANYSKFNAPGQASYPETSKTPPASYPPLANTVADAKSDESKKPSNIPNGNAYSPSSSPGLAKNERSLGIQDKPSSYQNNNNNNNYYNGGNRYGPQGGRGYYNNNSSNNYQGRPYNNNRNYNNGSNSNYNNQNFTKTALGVSNNEVLPLNKPIIPLEKVIKVDTKHSKHAKNQHAGVNGSSSAHPLSSNSNGLVLGSSQQYQGSSMSNQVVLSNANSASLLNNSSLLLNNPVLSNSVTPSSATATAINLMRNNLNQQQQQQQPAQPQSPCLLTNELKKKVLALLDDYLDVCNRNDERQKQISKQNGDESKFAEEEEETESVSNEKASFDTIDELITLIKTNKLNNEQISEIVRIIIVHSLPKTDQDRFNVSKLFIEFHNHQPLQSPREPGSQSSNMQMTADLFMNSFKVVLKNLQNLEVEYHCVKSNISLYAARAVCDQIITFSDLANLMKNGAYYPLFFLCMQNMHRLKSPEWLRAQLEKSKITLTDMLPSK